MSSRSSSRAILIAACLGVTLPACGATLDVPSTQYPHIQDAINAASTGDTVLAAPGTYFENIDFMGKAITVTSSGGAAATIIDGGGSASVVSFITAETRASVLSGFTITDGGFVGNDLHISGIYVYEAGPTIANNIIAANDCTGVYIDSGYALVQNNEIRSNKPPPISSRHSPCANYATGVSLENSFSGASATHYSVITGNTIEDNTGATGQCGFRVDADHAVIENNIIRNNNLLGGAVLAGGSASNMSFIQNLIYGNPVPGPVDMLMSGTSVIAQNTIIGDFPGNTSVALLNFSGDLAQSTVANNIVINNNASGAVFNCVSSSSPVFSHNDFYNSTGPAYASGCANPNPIGTSGNISVDPVFADPGNSNYHLTIFSPAVDAGDNSAYPLLPADLDGNPRVADVTGNGCVVDMGVYEYPASLGLCSPIETLQSSLNPSIYGQPVTFTAQLTSSSGVPAGTIQFSDGATVLGTEPISNTGSSTFTTSQLTLGSHVITAAYQPTGSLFATTARLTQVVNGYPTTLTLTSSLNPSHAFQPVLLTAQITATAPIPAPAGSVITFLAGTSPIGSGTLNAAGIATATVSLPVGSYGITAVFNATANFAASSSNSVTQNIVADATTITLTATPDPGIQYSAVSLLSQVLPVSSTPPPYNATGTVTFYDGSTALSTVALDGATAPQSSLLFSAGDHTITASYSGDTNFLQVSSAPVVLHIAPYDFTITTPPAFTLQTGHHGSLSMSVTSLGTFADAVTFSCSELPPIATCTFSSNPLSLRAGETVNASVLIETDAVPYFKSGLRRPASPFVEHTGLTLAMLLPFTLFFLRRRKITTQLLTVLLALTVFSLSACSGKYPASTPPGNYTITITGLDQSTHISHSANVTFVVTP